MNFSFNNLSKVDFTSTTPQYLKPFDIYKVNLTKIEDTSIKGKDGTEYKIVALQFNGAGENKGIFTHNIFIPNKEDDFKRRTNSTSGAQYPSAFEQFQYTLMQILQVINPEGAKKLTKISEEGKLKTIEQFVSLVVKGLQNKTDVDVYIKLIGRNVNGTFYANLPNACVLGRDATAETMPSIIRFISSDEKELSFSNYELTQMKQYKSAKPTNMDKVENNPDSSDDEVDLDGIEL